MTQNNNMPEEINVIYEAMYESGNPAECTTFFLGCDKPYWDGDTNYTRTDIVDKLRAENERLKEALQKIDQVCDTADDHPEDISFMIQDIVRQALTAEDLE